MQNSASIKKLTPKNNVSVLGAGRSGRAAIKLLVALGIPVTLHEKSLHNIPNDFQNFLKKHAIPCIEGEHLPSHFENTDTIIPSPGVCINPLLAILPKEKDIISETEFALAYVQETPLLAITGTSGKTTTTSLCGAMLEAQNIPAFIGGNIGTPLSEYVIEHISPVLAPSSSQKIHPKADVLVLELSSFQLQTSQNIAPHVAICMNISPNHLDYHSDMQEYIDAKMNIFKNQKNTDFALLGDTLKELKVSGQASCTYINSHAQNFPQTKLLGQHNQINAEAAYLATAHFGVSKENAEKAVKEFEPIENRLEFVAQINGVNYVNDSKSTTVEALKVALESFQNKENHLCLLAGGKFKGGDLESLIPLLQKTVKHIALFGGSREHFEKAWEGKLPLSWNQDLSQAIQYLQNIVVDGDSVLLSPATSSFDQYPNYEARGTDFRNIVFGLI